MKNPGDQQQPDDDDGGFPDDFARFNSVSIAFSRAVGLLKEINMPCICHLTKPETCWTCRRNAFLTATAAQQQPSPTAGPGAACEVDLPPEYFKAMADAVDDIAAPSPSTGEPAGDVPLCKACGKRANLLSSARGDGVAKPCFVCGGQTECRFDEPAATCPCSGCGGPTRFIGKGLYECTTGCRWDDPCPHAIRLIDCRVCSSTPAAPTGELVRREDVVRWLRLRWKWRIDEDPRTRLNAYGLSEALADGSWLRDLAALGPEVEGFTQVSPGVYVGRESTSVFARPDDSAKGEARICAVACEAGLLCKSKCVRRRGHDGLCRCTEHVGNRTDETHAPAPTTKERL